MHQYDQSLIFRQKSENISSGSHTGRCFPEILCSDREQTPMGELSIECSCPKLRQISWSAEK